MKKSILIGVSIITVLAILLAAVALGFGNTSTKFNAFADAQVHKKVTEQAPPEVQADNGISEITMKGATQQAQSNVSFKILQPAYIPTGYRTNTWQISGTKFRGSSLEAEQVAIPYIKGDELFAKNEYLNLKEFLTIKDDTDVSGSTSEIPYKFVDINGVQGRFLEETNGVKSLNWNIGNLSLTISSYAYKENNFTGTSITLEEMAKMARSVK